MPEAAVTAEEKLPLAGEKLPFAEEKLPLFERLRFRSAYRGRFASAI
ncbi:hypothetical protein PV433_21665 [Paenibacillus sp. GYB004]